MFVLVQPFALPLLGTDWLKLLSLSRFGPYCAKVSEKSGWT